MLLLVHGRHGNEDVPWIFARNIPDHWLIISPRAIEFDPESDEHDTGYSWMEMPETGWPEIQAFDGAVQALADFVEALPDTYNADPEKIIVLGFSQGAATAFATAVSQPELFKGVASLVGFIPELDDVLISSKPLKKLSVFMTAGDQDDRIPVQIANRSRDIVQSAGADLRWEMYSVGHKLNSQGMRDLGAWLTQMIQLLDGKFYNEDEG